MRKFLIVSFIALGLVSCSSVERQRTLADIGAYVGAPAHPDGSLAKDAAGQPIFDGVPDYDPIEVAAAAAKGAAGSATTAGPYGLIGWVLGGLGAVGLGWYKRKFLIDATKSVAAVVGAIGKPINGKEPNSSTSLSSVTTVTAGGIGNPGAPGAPGSPGNLDGTGGAGGSGGAGGLGGAGGGSTISAGAP
jgi:hypothetical protein